MSKQFEPLAGIVTTDLAAITRGRFIQAYKFDDLKSRGVGWIPSNLSLTAFNRLASRNIWLSSGDLRLIPDEKARFTTSKTGTETAFDMIMGDLTEIDGSPWIACPRYFLKQAINALYQATGLKLKVAFEQEFYVFETGKAPAHSLSFSGLRQLDPFASQLVVALSDANIEPEVVLAELGFGQLEISIAPDDPLYAADKAIAVREITRELVRNYGWECSFAPKPLADQAGNGVHIHFSLTDADDRSCSYDENGTAKMSASMAAFCAGILAHLPAILALTAPSVSSYMRLKPYNWSSSYTWLAEQDREASLRVCPVLKLPGLNVSEQLNVEYRACDATANPYLALAMLIHSGLDGITNKLKLPILTDKNPEEMSQPERDHHQLKRLPETLEKALDALKTDPIALGWLPEPLRETFFAVKEYEIEHVAHLDQEDIAALYRKLY